VKKIFFFPLIFASIVFSASLASCSSQQPKVTITPKVIITLLPTLTATPNLPPKLTPTRTPPLVSTKDQTQTAIEQLAMSTQSVFQTKVAQFSRLCPEDVPYFSDHDTSFSPDGLWLGELCLSSEYKDLILTFSNKATQVVWKMFYHDYIPGTAKFADGGMRVVHWSNDSRYAYFYTSLGGSVAECFYEGYDTGEGLFRLDLQTGKTNEILPLNDDLRWYGFSFSPADRHLVYGVRAIDLSILDVTTEGTINVAHEKDFSQGGGYVWSPDKLKFVYSTVKYLPIHLNLSCLTGTFAA